METTKVILLTLTFICICQFQLASSQSQPQAGSAQHSQLVQVQGHHTNQVTQHSASGETGPNSSKTAGDTGYSQYTYRAPGLTGSSATTYTNYPENYARDVYGTSRDATGKPIFGVASDFQLSASAYFGQIFWGCLAVTITLLASIGIVRLITGTDIVGGLVDKIKETGATGKSMDLDGLTNMVYQAFDTYGKWASKEIRQGFEVNQKGR